MSFQGGNPLNPQFFVPVPLKKLQASAATANTIQTLESDCFDPDNGHQYK